MIKVVSFLKSPWAIFGGILIGIIVGLTSQNITELIAPWGDIYVRFLEMLIIPIIITAVTSSIGKLLKSKQTGRFLKKLIFTIIGGLIFASILGISFATIAGPGRNLKLESKIGLGKIITKYQKGIVEIVPEQTISIRQKEKEKKESLFGFLTKLVPNNLFLALSRGENVKILFFSIIFGIVLGLIKNKNGLMFVDLLSLMFDTFEKIIFFALYLLPFALICLLAKQMSEAGTVVLNILIKYVIAYFILIFCMFSINLLLIWKMAKIKFVDTFLAFKEAILIAFGSANVYVALPSAIRALQTKLKLDANTVKLVLPIGISIFPFGSTCFYAFNAIFLAQVFDINLGVQEYIIVLVGALLASMGSVGAPVLIKISMLSILLLPLKIPLGPAIIILTAIKPITESFEEVWDLHTNLVLTTFIAKK